jgi:hypothetical protein
MAFVTKGALETARSDFGLYTEAKVLKFIGNDGIEKPKHLRTAIWENNPKPENVVWVDSYEFFSSADFGYLAFFRALTGKWMIKSFKKNDQPDQRSFPFKEALAKFKI